MVHILEDGFGTYMVTWADEDQFIHARRFCCRHDAKVFARKLRCRRRIDALLDEIDAIRRRPNPPNGEAVQ